MSREEYFGDWSRVIDFKELDNVLKKVAKRPVCPEPKSIFKAFECCPFQDLKVVMLGQDPYSDFVDKKPRATGIAFANSKETLEENLSPSLKILRESVINYEVPHGHIIFDPSLENWEEQGVLMLNAALTCEAFKSGSHALIWRNFISSLLSNLSNTCTAIVYVLMGNYAHSFEGCINKKFNHIIKCNHPSYYARTNTKMPYSLWSDINNLVEGINGERIEWYKEIK